MAALGSKTITKVPDREEPTPEFFGQRKRPDSGQFRFRLDGWFAWSSSSARVSRPRRFPDRRSPERQLRRNEWTGPLSTQMDPSQLSRLGLVHVVEPTGLSLDGHASAGSASASARR